MIEGKAAGMEGFSGRNAAGFQLTGLVRDWPFLSDLFTDVFSGPEFPESEVEHTRRVVEDDLKSLEDHSSRLCSQLFMETLFEHHPYGRLPLGTLESIKKISTQDLKAQHAQWFKPERVVIGVSGSVPEKVLLEWSENLDRTLMSRLGGASSKKEETIHVEPHLKAPRWIHKNLGREQLHIIVGGLGISLHSEDRFALRLMQNVLGGQSGRLFIELREKKSLGYTVSPISMEGMERGYVGTYIACAPDKKDEALSGIKLVLETLAKKGPSPKEVARAKEYYLGQRAMELQSDSSLAAHFGVQELFNLRTMSEEAYVKRIQSITAKDIQAVCRKYLVEQFMVTAVVG